MDLMLPVPSLTRFVYDRGQAMDLTAPAPSLTRSVYDRGQAMDLTTPVPSQAGSRGWFQVSWLQAPEISPRPPVWKCLRPP